jgi:hypothetical protein
VPTIAGQVPLHPLEELRGDPAGIATDAAEYLVRHAHGWWLPIDLDVLAGSEFPACDAATDPAGMGGTGVEGGARARDGSAGGVCEGLE